MIPGEYFTWNRYLHIATVDGALPTQVLLDRTISLTYFDRIQDYDSIEWVLDNRDGMLTRPEYIALGLLVRLKIGYYDGGFPWKAFIINRVQGGLGVWGRKDAAMGEDESKVTFYGRNRNAPGGRGSRPWKRRATPPPKKPKKHYPATTDITVHELLLDQTDKPRVVKATSTADAVTKIAARNGFDQNYALIEPTHDTGIEQVVLEEGESDGAFLSKLARAWQREFKVDGQVLRWHSRHWAGAKRELADSLHYGRGEDIIRLMVDCDFKLPVPGRYKAVGYNYKMRSMVVSDSERVSAGNFTAVCYSDILGDPGRHQSLTKYEVIPVNASTLPHANTKGLTAFINKHMRAFILIVNTVGNPKLLAGREINIDGVGSPFADGRWLIDEAQHKVDETTYVTEVKLKPPSRGASNAGAFKAARVLDAEHGFKGGVVYIAGFRTEASLRQQ